MTNCLVFKILETVYSDYEINNNNKSDSLRVREAGTRDFIWQFCLKKSLNYLSL